MTSCDGHGLRRARTGPSAVLYEDDQLRIVSSDRPGTVLLIGELDVTNRDALARVLAGVRARYGRVTVDCSRLTFVDVAGWRVLTAPNGDPSGRPELINAAPCVHRLGRLITER